jgi:hypothetical protein
VEKPATVRSVRIFDGFKYVAEPVGTSFVVETLGEIDREQNDWGLICGPDKSWKPSEWMIDRTRDICLVEHPIRLPDADEHRYLLGWQGHQVCATSGNRQPGVERLTISSLYIPDALRAKRQEVIRLLREALAASCQCDRYRPLQTLFIHIPDDEDANFRSPGSA